jgi:hypothetical protein
MTKQQMEDFKQLAEDAEKWPDTLSPMYCRHAEAIVEAQRLLEWYAKRCAWYQGELDRLHNKLNTDSQTFELGCLKEQVKLLQKKIDCDHCWVDYSNGQFCYKCGTRGDR